MTANRRWAELDGDTVTRVIVYDGDDPADLLGAGTWVETVPEIDPGPTEVAYCGPGYRYATNRPELFAKEWTQPVADLETGWEGQAYDEGAIVWHNGALYRSTTPVNVWEPGVSGWHGTTVGGSPSPWVQPTGAHDAYTLGALVTHNGQTWENTGSNANVWAPGVFGWVVVS